MNTIPRPKVSKFDRFIDKALDRLILPLMHKGKIRDKIGRKINSYRQGRLAKRLCMPVTDQYYTPGVETVL